MDILVLSFLDSTIVLGDDTSSRSFKRQVTCFLYYRLHPCQYLAVRLTGKCTLFSTIDPCKHTFILYLPLVSFSHVLRLVCHTSDRILRSIIPLAGAFSTKPSGRCLHFFNPLDNMYPLLSSPILLATMPNYCTARAQYGNGTNMGIDCF